MIWLSIKCHYLLLIFSKCASNEFLLKTFTLSPKRVVWFGSVWFGTVRFGSVCIESVWVGSVWFVSILFGSVWFGSV